MGLTRVVAITGCDSGLGWALAARMAREGLVTVAGMLNGAETNAALALKGLSAHPCLLDVTNSESVTEFRNYVNNLIKENTGYALYAVVNNAGVMTIGDYEWLTPKMIEDTINVNLLGAMRVTSTFLPDLRVNALSSGMRPRVINVASHCGLQPMPGFGAYSASKAGLMAWTQALRYEHIAHGLSVLAFVPGGFVGSSSILMNQGNKGKLMLENLNDEQKSFYENRLTALTNYLGSASDETLNYDSLRDERIIETFMTALKSDNPKEMYKVESWRYKFYYTLMKLPFPEYILMLLFKRFLCFPD